MISSNNKRFETGSLPKKAPVSLNDFSSYCTQSKWSSGKLPNRKDLESYFNKDKLLDKTTILGLFFLQNDSWKRVGGEEAYSLLRFMLRTDK